MSFVVPDGIEVETLNTLLAPAMTLRIYGNNKVPAGTDVAANYTEISGGGYVNKPVIFANWTIVSGVSQATYAAQTFLFSGLIDAPGTIYGYYITRNSDGKLFLAERFPAANIPFAPVAGSKIVLLPTYAATSQF
jgi:hypothetical protein